MPLAELNIARPRYPLDDPRLLDFMSALDRVNALAERSDGFLWRLKGDGNNATDLAIPAEPGAIVNISVWRDAAALEHFVWNTVHHRFYRRRSEWFDDYRTAYFVMWHVADGHRPTLAEAAERLAHLRAFGSTDHAFGWDHLATLTRWREGRCAAGA
jgi:hypothetical protein